MNESASARAQSKLERARERLDRLQAQQLHRDLKAELRAKERNRRSQDRHRFALGQTVENAGCAGWPRALLVGALLEQQERLASAPGLRGAFMARGENHLDPTRSATTSDDLERALG